MEKEEYKKTINLLIKQKNILIQSINETKNDNISLQGILNNIFFIDNKIKEYYQLISNDENNINKDNYINNNILEINTKENTKENANNSKDNNDTKKIKNIKNKKVKYCKTSLKDVILDKEVIKDIKANNGKTIISIYSKENNITTKYTFKKETKNFIFYQCKKRPLCKGKGKFNKKNEIFQITHYCSNYDKHKQINYEEFVEKMENKSYSEIDFNITSNQKKLIYYIFSKNKNIENTEIKTEYYKYTNINLKLNNKIISKIKSKIFGKYRNLNLIECLSKIHIPNINLDIKSKDIIYKIKTNNNKLITRNDKIIIFGNKERLKLLNNIPLEEFFLDITFKLIPDVYKPYKVMTLSAINYKDHISILVCLIFFSYMDSISYYNIFKYLNEIYKFRPKIIHSDFEMALNNAIEKIDFVKNKIIHIKCLFHFSNAIWNKIKELGLKKKNIAKIIILFLIMLIYCFL